MTKPLAPSWCTCFLTGVTSTMIPFVALSHLISSHFHILFTYPKVLGSGSRHTIFILSALSINNDGDGRFSHNNRMGTPLRTWLPYRPRSHAVHAIPAEPHLRLPGLAARLQRMCKRPHFGICAHTLSMARIVTYSGHPQWWETPRLPTSALAKCNRSVRGPRQ